MQDKVPEASDLEYKRELDLSTDRKKREVLRDLTAMGNGGGGVIIFGVEEDQAAPDLPGQVTPLTDQSLPGRLENVVRDGVRPPLLMRLHQVHWGGGYVLVAEVSPSHLGPYMVCRYGEPCYYSRLGSQVAPMSEQQVRDAYALALRGLENREAEWRRHQLPVELSTPRPYLAICALPTLVSERLPPERMRLEELRPPSRLERVAKAGGFWEATSRLRVWAEGVYGEFPEAPNLSGEGGWQIFRLHRDGAVVLAATLHGASPEWVLGRRIVAALAYLGWLFGELALSVPVELDIRIANPRLIRLRGTGVPPIDPRDLEFQRPVGIQAMPLVLREMVMADQLRNARERHWLAWRFANKAAHAYGIPEADPWGFKEGWLYGRNGQATGYYVRGGGICRKGAPYDAVARVRRDGWVERMCDGTRIGFFEEGVLVDCHGHCLAASELAIGKGLPGDFLAQGVDDLGIRPPECLSARMDVGDAQAAPQPSSRWSDRALREVLEGS